MAVSVRRGDGVLAYEIVAECDVETGVWSQIARLR